MNKRFQIGRMVFWGFCFVAPLMATGCTQEGTTPGGPTPQPAVSGSPAGSPPASPGAKGTAAPHAATPVPGKSVAAVPGPTAVPYSQTDLPAEFPSTATPDPAHIVRAFADEKTLRPLHFVGPADSEFFIMLYNTGTSPCQLVVEGNGTRFESKPQDKGTQCMYPLKLKSGKYTVTISGRQTNTGELIIKTGLKQAAPAPQTQP